MSTHRCLISLIVALALTTPARSQDLVLRFAPVPGTEYRFGISQEQDMVMSLGPMGQHPISSSNRIEMRWTALDRAENGNTRMRMNLDRLVMNVTEGENVVMALDTDEIDQAKGTDDAGLMKAFKLALDFELIVTVTPNGAIEAVSGLERLWTSMGGLIGDSPEARQVLEMVQQGFAEETLIQQMRSVFPVFPQGGIKPKATWTDDSEAAHPMIGTVSMRSVYTLGEDTVHAGRPCRELLIKTGVEMQGGGDLMAQMQQMTGAEMDIEYDQIETAGTMCVDYSTGLPIVSTMDVGMGMAMTMAMPEDAEAPEGAESNPLGDGLEMKMDIKGKVTMKQLGAETVGE